MPGKLLTEGSGPRGAGGGRVLLQALGLYAVWTALTYLLEGRPLTLVRPEATALRLSYAILVNIIVGIVLAGVVLGAFLRTGDVTPARIGLRSPPRTVLAVALALGAGSLAFALQQPVTTAPLVLVNSFAQVLVVSIAEVVVCWAVVGNAVSAFAGSHLPKRAAVVLAWLAAAALFGVYHHAHSPPFNTGSMVALLTLVGLVTGAFYFLTGELYGTILFHNMLALKGVTDALAAGGHLDRYATVQLPLLATAVGASVVLFVVDRQLRRTIR